MTTRDGVDGIVYILRFHQPLGNPNKKHGTAQYYVGWAAGPKQLKRRLRQHKQGLGAKLTQAASKLKIGFELVCCWSGTRHEERRVKNYKNTRLFVERELWFPRPRGRIPF
jgi:predicted GIY-YIG superfamily endonuclease